MNYPASLRAHTQHTYMALSARHQHHLPSLIASSPVHLVRACMCVCVCAHVLGLYHMLSVRAISRLSSRASLQPDRIFCYRKLISPGGSTAQQHHALPLVLLFLHMRPFYKPNKDKKSFSGSNLQSRRVVKDSCRRVKYPDFLISNLSETVTLTGKYQVYGIRNCHTSV